MHIRKVAIYARDSTEHETQLSALENQVQYYDDLIDRHLDWVLYRGISMKGSQVPPYPNVKISCG